MTRLTRCIAYNTLHSNRSTETQHSPDGPSSSCNTVSSYSTACCSGQHVTRRIIDHRDAPRTRLASLDPRPLQILYQPLVVLHEPPELELRHRLLVRARGAHRGILDSNEGYDWYAFGLGKRLWLGGRARERRETEAKLRREELPCSRRGTRTEARTVVEIGR